ncbi:MAG: hypothetical protein M1839_003800 [Geoglossum umbratile]|nr:MAG: hypothetical protein M1839_003800 [Geoglossum umbratile]
MTTLPLPTCSFTIPSIHDGTLLDCRIYHPAPQPPPPRSPSPPPQPLPSSKRRKRGAVIAHPYAPLGGSYDDPVVAAVGRVLLGRGFVVGTFNFRGAGSSKGRTSWTSKAETADYVSFVGFFVFYLHYLETLRAGEHQREGLTLERISSAVPLTIEPPSSPLNNLQHPATATPSSPPLLILGGYSYGSLITSHLPTTASILALFTDPTSSPASSTSEILLRAHHCATERNKEEEECSSSSSPSPRGSSSHRRSGVYAQGVVMGGEEGEPRGRTSKELRRSIEVGRLSVEIPLPHLPSSKKKMKRRSADMRRNYSPPSTTPPPVPKTAYLLVSPILPPTSHFLIPSSPFKSPNQDPTQNNLSTHPTLAIYGTHDIFTSLRRLDRWAESMAESSSSNAGFKNTAVEGAGHFWVEEGGDKALKNGIGAWADGLSNLY